MSNYLQFQISPLATQEAARLGISVVQVSSILFAPLLPALVLSMPFGAIVDRLGAKPVITAVFLLTALASAARSVCTGYIDMFTAHAIMGVGPAALNANIVKIFGIRFKNRTDFSLGWYYAASSAGMAAALATSGFFPNAPHAYLAASVMVVLPTIAWALLVKNDKHEENTAAKSHAGMLEFASIAKIGHVWVISAILGVGIAATETYAGYYPSVLGAYVGPAAAGGLASLLALGNIVGSVCSPILRARTKSYKGYMLALSVAATGLLFLTCLFSSIHPPLLIFLTGAFSAACGPIIQGLLYQLPQIGPENAGRAGGFVSMTSLGLTYALPLAISYVSGGDYLLLIYASVALYALSIPLILLLPKPASLKA